ncbi:MAG: hypothetical protein AABZ74_12425 [Cyanobacteriota bacterium]
MNINKNGFNNKGNNLNNQSISNIFDNIFIFSATLILFPQVFKSDYFFLVQTVFIISIILKTVYLSKANKKINSLKEK